MGQCAVGASVAAVAGLTTMRSAAQSDQQPTDMDLVRAAEPALSSGLERRYLMDAWDSTFVSGAAGSYLHKFEETFPPLCGCQYGVACCNGTVAIDLALRALNIEQGEEVLLPDWTYVADGSATITAGGVPVLIDCDRYGRIDPLAIRKALEGRCADSPKRRFLWVVHLFGLPCDMDAIMELAEEFELIVLEDAAQAHGARYKNRLVGSFGRLSTFSFFANKIITTGEGGMVCTNDQQLATRLSFLATHAQSPTQRYSNTPAACSAQSRMCRYYHTEIGCNYRLSNLLCAVGCAQVERFDEISDARAALIDFYRTELDGFCNLQVGGCWHWLAAQMLRRVAVQVNPNPDSTNIQMAAYMAFVILPPELTGARDAILESLMTDFKVDSRPFFSPLSTMPCYAKFETVSKTGCGMPCTEAAKVHTSGFSLPTAAYMSLEHKRRVVSSLRAVVKAYWAPATS